MNRAVFISLTLLLPLKENAAQLPEKVTRFPGRASCTSCAVVLTPAATISAPQEASELGYFSTLAVSSRGHVTVSSDDGAKILLFGTNGNFVRAFGVKGSGPGEFTRIAKLVYGPQDSLFVFEARKVHVFDPSLRFARTHALPGAIQAAVPQSDGSMLVGMQIASEKAHGYPVHLLSSRGQPIKSFGQQGRVSHDPRCRVCNKLVFTSSGIANRIVVSAPNSYAWEVWSSGGQLLSSYRVDSEWFKPWTDTGNWLSGESPKPPSIANVAIDSNKRFWIALTRAPATWKRQAPPDGVTAGPRGVAFANRQGASYYMVERDSASIETVIQVVDPATGVVATSTHPGTVILLSSSLAYRMSVDEDEGIVFRLLRLSMTER